MTYFFARTNAFGSETSTGFANTMKVVAFGSKQARDAWVAANEDRNMAVEKLTKAAALKLCDRNGGAVMAENVDGDFVRVA
jgi:hypothetical protein